VVPATHKVSPDEGLQLGNGQRFGIDSVVEQFAFQSGPHTFAAGIIVASAASAVHALAYAMFG
jgi:hypothetical protein